LSHSYDGRGYIWIINSLLLLSVHTTCHRRCQAKVTVTDVVWGFPLHHWNGKWHCHSLMIYSASKTYCTWFAHNEWCPLLVLVTQFTPKVQMVGFLDQRHYRTPLTLTLLPHIHNRIGLHCSLKSETSCPTPSLLQTETEALSGSDAMTLSCDLTLVTALVTRDWWPYRHSFSHPCLSFMTQTLIWNQNALYMKAAFCIFETRANQQFLISYLCSAPTK
jgi:hypothetical protein